MILQYDCMAAHVMEEGSKNVNVMAPNPGRIRTRSEFEFEGVTCIDSNQREDS